MTRYLLVTMFLAGLVAGCATTPRGDGEVEGVGPLAGLEERAWRPTWEEWTPREGPVDAFDDATYAFDYWVLDDAELREDVWTGFFALLQGIRGAEDTPTGADDTIRMLMSELEPTQAQPLHFDATFVVRPPDREGMALRMYRSVPSGGTIGMTVRLLRRSGAPVDRIDAWLYSGHSEAPSLTLGVERRSPSDWSMKIEEDIESVDPTTAPATQTASLLASIATSNVWRPFTGKRYVEAQAKTTASTEPLPGPYQAAAGLEVRDRDIDHVFTDSVFPPRMTEFETGR